MFFDFEVSRKPSASDETPGLCQGFIGVRPLHNQFIEWGGGGVWRGEEDIRLKIWEMHTLGANIPARKYGILHRWMVFKLLALFYIFVCNMVYYLVHCTLPPPPADSKI